LTCLTFAPEQVECCLKIAHSVLKCNPDLTHFFLRQCLGCCCASRFMLAKQGAQWVSVTIWVMAKDHKWTRASIHNGLARDHYLCPRSFLKFNSWHVFLCQKTISESLSNRLSLLNGLIKLAKRPSAITSCHILCKLLSASSPIRNANCKGESY
jgi:hypothetical protein